MRCDKRVPPSLTPSPWDGKTFEDPMKTLFLPLFLFVLPLHTFAVDGLPSDHYDDYDVQKYQNIHDEAARRAGTARARLDETDRSLQAAQGEEMRLRNLLDSLNRQIQELQRDDQSTHQAIQAMIAEQQNLYSELQRRAAQIQELQGQVQTVTQHLAQAQARQAEVQKNFNEQARQLEVLNQALRTQKQNLDEKQAAVESNRKAMEAAAAEAEQAMQARKAMADAIQALKDQKLPQAQAEKQAAAVEIPGKQEAKTALEDRVRALDSDIEKLKAAIEVAKAAGEKEKVAQLQALLQQRQAQRQAAQQELQLATRALQQAEQRLVRADAAIEQIRAEIQQKEAQLPALQQRAQDARARAEQLRANQPALVAALEQAKKAFEEARAVVQTQQTKVNEVKQRLDEITARLREIAERKQRLEQQLQVSRQEYASQEQRYRDLNSRRQALENRLQAVRQALAARARERDDAAQQLVQAERVRREWEVARAQALNEFQAQDQDRARKLVRLQEVQGNVEMARQRMSEVAGSHGAQDGAREGQEFALAEGQRDGQERGDAQGRARGISEGKQRHYNMGYETGKARGIERGRVDATAKAEANGNKDGSAKGRADGLVVAFNNGKAEGLEHGEKTGSDQVAYARGRKQGESEGLERAREEAQEQEPVGYNDKEQEFLRANLKQVTIGDDTIAAHFAGLQAGGAKHGDGRHYNPRPNQYPHPMITDFYRGFYDQAYRASLDDTYARVYRSTYDSTYAASFEAARAEAAAKDYPEDRARGDQEAYARFYKETYDRVYASEYRARYQRHYDAAYAVAKEDAAEKKRGFDIGNAIASEEKGLHEGRVAGYENNLEGEKKIAYERGQRAANKRYTENAVIEVVSSSMVDANRDGIFMPGEAAVVELVVKNFGHQAKKDLRALLQVSGRGISVPNADVTIAALPGQSLVKVRAATRALIAANTQEATQFGLRFTAADADVRHQNNFAATVSFPSVVVAQGFNGAIVPGAMTKLKLAVTNRSRSVQNLVVNVDVDESKAAIGQSQIALAPLAAGAAAEVEVELFGKQEAHFQAAPITVKTAQSGLAYAKTLVVNAAVLRKHQKNQGAKGLLLGSDLSKAGAKDLFAAQLMDTWDLRIDGVIQDQALLDVYLDRTVHFVTDGTALDRASLANLKAFVAKGGALVVWGAEMGQVASQLSSVSGVQRADHVTSLGDLAGVGVLDDVRIDNVDAGGILTLGGAKVRAALLDGRRAVVGASNHVNEFTDQVGRVLTIAVSPESLTKEQILAVQARVDRVRLSFARKIELATAKASDLGLVMDALEEEMRDDAVRSDVRWFKDNDDETKLAKAIDTFLKKDHPRRMDIAKLYPEAVAAAKRMTDSTDRDTVLSMLEWRRVGGFFSKRSWKDLYCENFDSGNTGLCPDPFDHGNGN